MTGQQIQDKDKAGKIQIYKGKKMKISDAQKIIEPAVHVAIRMLEGQRTIPASEKMKNTAKSLIGRGKTVHDPIFWPAGLLMTGLECMAEGLIEAEAKGQGTRDETGADTGQRAEHDDLIREMDQAVISHVRFWLDQDKGKLRNPDDSLAGYAMLKLVKGGRADSDADMLMSSADKIYEYIISLPRNRNGVIIYNPRSGNDYVFADGIGETCCFLSLYSAVSGKSEAAELAGHMLEEFILNGTDERTGLLYHAYSQQEGYRLGILGWSRAVGWMLLGLKSYVDNVKERDPGIRIWFDRLSDTAFSYRLPDSMVAWALPCSDSHVDTSASCMLAAASNNAFFADEVCEAVISRYMDNDGKVGSVLSACEDIAVHRQVYGSYPWGQGAFLMALGRALRHG